MNEPRAPKLNVTQELRRIMTGECEDPAEHLQQLGYLLFKIGQTLETNPAADVRTVLGQELEIG